MKKRKLLVSILCAAALLGVSTATLTSCKENKDPEPTPEVLKYEVTFNSNGGSAVAKKTDVEKGAKITKPTDPTKENFTFGGWYKDSNCTQEWKFGTDTVTSDITLYAKWTPNGETPVEKFTVTFDSDGGSAVAAITNVEKGSKISKPADPTKEGYTFVKWAKADGTTAWNFDTDTVTANITLKAIWVEDGGDTPVEKPKATLVYNNGSDNGTLVSVEDEGLYFYDKPTDPKKDYHVFAGWYKDEECTDAYNFDNEAVDGITLYAKYEQAYDTVYSQLDLQETLNVMGSAAISETMTIGRYTYAAGVRHDGTGKGINLQGKTITFELTAENNMNGFTFLATAASGDSATFYLKNLDTGAVVHEIPNVGTHPGGVATVDFTKKDLPAGRYEISLIKDKDGKGASVRITGMSIEEKLPQGPTTGIVLSTSTVQSQYLAGRPFSSEGLEVLLEYENGRKDKLSSDKYTISPVDTSTAGKKTITVTYQFNSTTTYTKTFEINVYAIEELVVYTHVLDAKSVTHNAQTLFAKDGTFNSDNIAVKAKCLLPKANDADPQKYIEFVLTAGEYALVAPDLTTVGNKSVQISYKGDATKTVSYDIEVVEIPDHSQDGLVMVYVDPDAEQLVAGKFAGDQDCFYVHTINQALQFFELAKVTDEAEKGILLKKSTIFWEKVEINIPNLKMGTLDETTNDGLPANASEYATIAFDAINGQLDPSETISYETSGSATISVRAEATNFCAMGIKFMNYWYTAERYAQALKIYGDSKTQAVAVLVEADKASFASCVFSSYQDTLYAKKGRQAYLNCHIEGHTDFIFGDDATAVFEGCEIKTIGNDDEKNGGYVVATKGNSSNSKELTYGYIFNHCDFTADEHTVAGTTSLGRAWAKGMSMMVMNSTLGAHISNEAYGEITPEGPNKNDRYGKLSSAPNAALILEYNNTGAGAIQVSLADTCTVISDAEQAAPYENLHKVYGADNGSVQYTDVWFPPMQEDSYNYATIVIKDQSGNVLQTIEEASWVGSTITKSMLDAAFDIPEGYELDGYFSDLACTVAYDFSTVLLEGADSNVIYAKLTNKADISTTTYTMQLPTEATAWTAETQINDIFYITPGAKGAKTESLKNGAVAYGNLTFGPQQISLTGGKAAVDSQAVKIVLANEAKVTVYCGSKSDKTINLSVLAADGKAAELSNLMINDQAATALTDATLSITAAADKYEFTLKAGTYYIGGTGGGCYIYGMTVDVRNA